MVRYTVLLTAAIILICVSLPGCESNKSTNPVTPAFVITGVVQDTGVGIRGATVTVSVDTATTFQTTDNDGAYTIELDLRPDSLEICISATNYIDTCQNFITAGDTLVADWTLQPIPPKDSIWVGADTVLAGDTAEVLLYLGNPDSAVASVNVWLKPEVTSIHYDTAESVTPRFPLTGMTWNTGRHDAENIVSVLIVDFTGSTVIPPGSGPLMRFRFAVDPGTPPGAYAINAEATAGVPYAVAISYPSGLSVPPVLFIPGTIVVQ